MAGQVDTQRLIRDMLGKGWRWSETEVDVLVHPGDHALSVRYNRAAGTLSVSAAMDTALDLVIPTPTSQSSRYWRDEQKAEKDSSTTT